MALVVGDNWAEHRAKKSMRFCRDCNWEQNANSIVSLRARQRERFTQKKANAKRKGIEFTLKFDDVMWPTHCPVLGAELDYSIRRSNKREGRGSGGHHVNKATTPSFDRIDPTKGYVKGNVIIVSSRANTIKNNATPEELRRVAAFYTQLISDVGEPNAE